MKAVSLFLFFMLIVSSLFSQTQVNASGGKATGTTGNIEYSISGIVDVKATGTTAYIITGVQQPQEISILPITLLNFSGIVLNNNLVQLNWSTVYEKDNAFFALEKSNNGVEFVTINTQKSLGNSNNQKQEYSYTHSVAFSPIIFYRLKQVDINGKFTYSKIIAISLKEMVEVKAFPNPTNAILNLICNNFENKKYSYKLINTEGKILQTNFINNNVTKLSLNSVPKGIYWVSIISDKKQIQLLKIIKN